MLRYVNINPFNNGDHAEADCALAAGLGFDGVRISEEFGWSNWEASLDVFNAAAKNHGLKIIQTCQPINHSLPRTSKDISAYAEKVAICASKSEVKFIGVGNENNGFGINDNWDPSLSADVTLACLQACANLGSGVMSGKFVVTPEVCPGSGLPKNKVWPAYSEPLSWFTAMLYAQPGILTMPHVAIGWHPYDDPHYPADTNQAWNTCYKALQADEMIFSLLGRHLPFVFGEYGTAIKRDGLKTPQAVTTEAEQTAAYLDYDRAFKSFSKQGMKIRAAAWYTLQDVTMGDTNDWASCTGLLALNGDERDICTAVREKNGV